MSACKFCGYEEWAHYPYAPLVNSWMSDEHRTILGQIGLVMAMMPSKVGGLKGVALYELFERYAVFTQEDLRLWQMSRERHTIKSVRRFALRMAKADKLGIKVDPRVNVVRNSKALATYEKKSQEVTVDSILRRIDQCAGNANGHAHNFTLATTSAADPGQYVGFISADTAAALNATRTSGLSLEDRLKLIPAERRWPCPIHRKQMSSAPPTE